MMFCILISLCLVSFASSQGFFNTCQEYCASQNVHASYDNCSPWNSYDLGSNKTCYNLCVHNCVSVYDRACMIGNNFRCCLPTTQSKTQKFKTSGCNKLYNNL